LTDPDFSRRADANQALLRTNLKPQYDFVVCGAGSSGCVVARRLAENESVDVLLIEAGGSDDVASVNEPGLWPTNLGSERDWGFQAEPNPHLNGRSIGMSMGKALGGGSSINVMVWAQGHRQDWDFFASEAGDYAWDYDAVLDIYRRIEDWQGSADPVYRGRGGPVWVQPPPDPSPVAHAMIEAAGSLGIPAFESPNGAMMQGEGGCAFPDVLIRDGRRQSIFRAYTYPFLDRPNLTVLTDALVSRVTIDGRRATGVEVLLDGAKRAVGARSEVILSLGAINTPKVLMHSGIGDEAELRRLSIPVVTHLPGVGQNLQDHVYFGCTWEYAAPIAPRNTGNEATLFWKSSPELSAPDLLLCQAEFPVPSPETVARGVPTDGWTMFAGLSRPKSRGRVRLRTADPRDPVAIEANTLAHPDDIEAAARCVKLAREIGNARAFERLTRREAMPGDLGDTEMEHFIRDAALTYWHQSCTAKMGRDRVSVVDATLKVYGIDHLRVADASIFPRVTSGNTMAPCVVVGERASQLLRQEHRI